MSSLQLPIETCHRALYSFLFQIASGLARTVPMSRRERCSLSLMLSMRWATHCTSCTRTCALGRLASAPRWIQSMVQNCLSTSAVSISQVCSLHEICPRSQIRAPIVAAQNRMTFPQTLSECLSASFASSSMGLSSAHKTLVVLSPSIYDRFEIQQQAHMAWSGVTSIFLEAVFLLCLAQPSYFFPFLKPCVLSLPLLIPIL